ncbi:unnamed protein product [Spirodela intermedia]|uniref:Protein kinase domain-containing protein n=1 Tax=Spirodela intermedia TaxID=51605 RepID=A0A7I8IIH0_SPIIN|nr:unnamed protein product [Spirodela intermedia]CAA6656754.1 unnamed protein product [Spirodela intermedia]
MQKLGSRVYSSGARKQDPTPNPSDFSQSSTYSAHSAVGSDSSGKFRVPKSFRGRVHGVAGSCITCFSPRHSGAWPDDEDDDDIHDFSTSTAAWTASGSKLKHGEASLHEGSTAFTMAEVNGATGNFSAANIIGQGGFGTVYRGRLRDGSLIAVKRAKKNLFDNHVGVEFKNEIQTLSQIEHLNLVRLLGYVEYGDERIILVEYVANGSLREHLDGSRGEGLEMGQRLDIAIDVAHAITYLHMYTDPPIIHRDVKASNVLITEKLRAKIKGTAGYLDPEYLQTYQLTEKSDVYSFGVLLVEIVSGRRPIDPKRDVRDRLTTKWAMNRFRSGNAVTAMDPRLRRNPASVMASLAPSRKSRPSMKRCGEVLWGIRKDFRDMELSAAAPASPSRCGTPRAGATVGRTRLHVPPASRSGRVFQPFSVPFCV